MSQKGDIELVIQCLLGDPMFIKLFLKSNMYFNIRISLFTVPMDMRVAMIVCTEMTDRMLGSNRLI